MDAADAFEPPPDDHQLAGQLAAETNELLMDLREECFEGGVGVWETRDLGDQRAHDYLIERLELARPDDIVLSEEGVDDPRRLEADRVWIVDPLDGTQDYPNPHSGEFAVHVAVCEGGRPVAASVGLPALGRVYTTGISPIDNEPERERPIVISSRSTTSAGAAVASALGGELLTAGSAGVKAMAVVGGMADVYVHASGLYEWDVCAPEAVAAAAGMVVTDIYGHPLEYNKPRPVVSGFIVSRPRYADTTLTALDW